ncbi:MAG: LysR family transcriptional regulator [Gammaproteobacteria bacterium]|nr:MAG: LysR family transcriptional regulator [Gammaproteobacteria bacterium]UCH40168.1 MAG: LysR family transcriptional regulator [Gammaproteobacteria bacterium]
MKRPRLNQLRTFEAAARHLSFSAAAQDLAISQSAVSQQIRQLEDYLGTALFNRHNRRLSLTSAGQAYYEVVSETFDRLDTVTRQLFPAHDRKTVTLLCSSSIAALWLLPQRKTLQASYPEIELRINTLDQSQGSGKPVNSDLEIYIATEGRAGVDAEKLLTATITPVCSPGFFELYGRPERPADLLEFDLIHILGYEDDWHRWFRQSDVTRVKVPDGLSVDGSLIAIEAAQRAEGIMLGRRPFIDHQIESGELVEVFRKPYYLYADYFLRQRAGSSGRREIGIVAEWIRQLAA